MKLHHIGKVVSNLDKAIKYYQDIFGLSKISDPIIDPLQKVEVVFIAVGFGRDLTLELIRPISEDSPVNKFLKAGGGLHHLCFEVDNINQALSKLKEKGGIILGKPLPGKGHNDRLTAWLYTPAKELVELVEKVRKENIRPLNNSTVSS